MRRCRGRACGCSSRCCTAALSQLLTRAGIALGLMAPASVGLGSVAAAHGGTTSSRALPSGGLEVTVELPAARS